MLDLGVGGGRTSRHFAPLVADYIGVDYSPEMIAACQQRFGDSLREARFEVADARDLSRFPDNYFDFILFSFNGIDYVSHSDRLQVLEEISRVGKPGGYFCFSTHNLQAMEREFDWRTHVSFNLLSSYVSLFVWMLLRGFNRSLNVNKLKNSSYAIVRDEPHNFQLYNYYIRPLDQLKQLEPHFQEVKIYSWKTGKEIESEEELLSNNEMWLYYLCAIA